MAPSPAAPKITITNLDRDEVLTYPLAILRGTTTSRARLIHVSTSDGPPSCIYPVTAGRFTVLYELQPGRNEIRLSHAAETLRHPALSTSHTLVYDPPPSHPPHVRLVYLLTADSSGAFQSPDAPAHRSRAAGLARLRTAGLMIQAATAEMMHAHGLQRRTFRLAPAVHVHRLPLTTAAALEKDGMALWQAAAESLRDAPDRDSIVDVAVMSFTRHDARGTRAHTALGGGPLALFGGGSMFTWPASVHEIGKRLRDWRAFDPSKWFDDSAGRMQRMGRRACTATTIGALLHELGHCLSLPHPTGDAEKDGGGIMARGFDHFDRLFVQPEKPAPLPFWDRGSAVRLKHHRFLQFVGESEMRRLRALHIQRRPQPTPGPMPPSRIPDGPPVFFKGINGTVVCHSAAGIGHVGYYKNGDNASHEEFIDAEPVEFHVPSLTELRRKCRATRTDKIVLSAIDLEGRITDKPYDEI